MGLDITAYSQIRFLHETSLGEDHSLEHPYFYTNPEVYPEQSEGIREGCYGFAASWGFRAGSYSGYNHWRNLLTQMAHGVSDEQVWEHPDKFPAFCELINFSDCEGVINAKVSAKLLQDFEEYLDKAEAFAKALSNSSPEEEGAWFCRRYKDWMTAFRLAANGGAVKFH